MSVVAVLVKIKTDAPKIFAGMRLSLSLALILMVISELVGGTEGIFFFSSRRRHTRSLRDWSSDVCSSDLYFLKFIKLLPILAQYHSNIKKKYAELMSFDLEVTWQIGRASCRERV